MNGEVPCTGNFFSPCPGKRFGKRHTRFGKIKSKICMRSLLFTNKRAIRLNLTCSGKL